MADAAGAKGEGTGEEEDEAYVVNPNACGCAPHWVSVGRIWAASPYCVSGPIAVQCLSQDRPNYKVRPYDAL